MATKKVFDIEVTRKVRVTEENVDDIMVGALEGGITYWCRKVVIVGVPLGDYASDQISRGGSLILYDAESTDCWELNIEKFLNGVKLWIEQGHDEYGALQSNGTLDCCQIDGDMADRIVQLALFGEVVFG